jgi:hypothetical protein
MTRVADGHRRRHHRRSRIARGPSSGLDVSPLVLGVAGLVGTCVSVGVIAWRSGILDDAPDLPTFGQPLDATELSNNEVSCDIRDEWFGPYVREIVFGTNTPPDQQLPVLAERYRSQGWQVTTYEAGSRRNSAFTASSPDDDMLVSYREESTVGRSGPRQYRFEIHVIVNDECHD